MTKVNQYIEALDSPMREIADQLCDIIRECSGDFSEAIKWQVPVFSIHKNVCSVIAHKAHVNLQIFEGAHLPDAAELQGTGSGMRHLKFASVEEIDRRVLHRYLKQAIAIDANKN